ncbi:hypothetical protein AB1Y20_015231 [Prymnesium parvum]|uniref:Uncharacterized protein n=1 Tax=Prymnesium parvum TaxID=97485 RepID=A0AB34JX52_PRYPA
MEEPRLSIKERLAAFERASANASGSSCSPPGRLRGHRSSSDAPPSSRLVRSLSATFSSPTKPSGPCTPPAASARGAVAPPMARAGSQAPALPREPSAIGEVEVAPVASVKSLQSVFKKPPSHEGEQAEDETRSLLDFRLELERVERHDPTLTWVDWTANRKFLALSSEQKSAVLLRLAAGRALETLLLNSTELDNKNASAVALLLRRTSRLQGISLEGNNLLESGLLEIAGALKGHASITEISVANQRRPLPTFAIDQLLSAMEATPTILHLGLGTLRDDATRKRHQTVTMANFEALRQRRQAAAAANGHGDDLPMASKVLQRRSASFERPKSRSLSKPTAVEEAAAPQRRAPSFEIRSRMLQISRVVDKVLETTAKVCDWAEEALRIKVNDNHEYGVPDESLELQPPAEHDEDDPWQALYVQSSSVFWGRASASERRQVVEAFGKNTRVRQVEMANAHVDDELAKAWAAALCTNSTLTSLNLETNHIGAEGITALAESLAHNETLRELKLAGQRVSCSQRAEEDFARALEAQHTLVRVSIDTRSTLARDLIAKVLQRNQERQRADRSPSAQAARLQKVPLPARERGASVPWVSGAASGRPHDGKLLDDRAEAERLRQQLRAMDEARLAARRQEQGAEPEEQAEPAVDATVGESSPPAAAAAPSHAAAARASHAADARSDAATPGSAEYLLAQRPRRPGRSSRNSARHSGSATESLAASVHAVLDASSVEAGDTPPADLEGARPLDIEDTSLPTLHPLPPPPHLEGTPEDEDVPPPPCLGDTPLPPHLEDPPIPPQLEETPSSPHLEDTPFPLDTKLPPPPEDPLLPPHLEHTPSPNFGIEQAPPPSLDIRIKPELVALARVGGAVPLSVDTARPESPRLLSRSSSVGKCARTTSPSSRRNERRSQRQRASGAASPPMNSRSDSLASCESSGLEEQHYPLPPSADVMLQPGEEVLPLAVRVSSAPSGIDDSACALLLRSSSETCARMGASPGTTRKYIVRRPTSERQPRLRARSSTCAGVTCAQRTEPPPLVNGERQAALSVDGTFSEATYQPDSAG